METPGQITLFLLGLLQVITLITFFVMAKALGNISENMRNVIKVLNAWQQETEYGFVRKCKKCGKFIIGKPAVCTDCEDKNDYSNVTTVSNDVRYDLLPADDKKIVDKMQRRGIAVDEKIIIHNTLRNIIKIPEKEWDPSGIHKDWQIIVH